MSVRGSLLAFCAVLMALSPADLVAAGEMSAIKKNESETINQFGTCRVVRNDGSIELMVPYGSAAEWSDGANSFLNNLGGMPGVKVSACGVGFAAASPYNATCVSPPYHAQLCIQKAVSNKATYESAGKNVVFKQVSKTEMTTVYYMSGDAFCASQSNAAIYMTVFFDGYSQGASRYIECA